MIISLQEYGSPVTAELTSGQAEALQRSRAIGVAPSIEQAGAWSLRATNFAGVILIDGGLEVRIRPKLSLARLLFLVTFSHDPRSWRSDVVDLIVEDDLVSSMGWAFARHTESALMPGVLQGYVRVEEALPGVRGRLREGDQLRRHFGIMLPVEVSYDDFTVDILENRLLLAACNRLLTIPTLPGAVRGRLRHLIGRLDGVGVLTRAQLMEDPHFTRINERYRPAVRLAQAILRGTSLEFGAGRTQGVGFLFDMNKVFEDFVTSTLGTALEGISGRVEAQCPSFLDERQAIDLRPDLVWWTNRRCRAVVDIKYKASKIDEVPNADLCQAIAYSLAFDVRPAFLVYAAGIETPGEHTVVHSDLRIVVLAVDVSQAPDQILASVRDVAGQIATRSNELDYSEVGLA